MDDDEKLVRMVRPLVELRSQKDEVDSGVARLNEDFESANLSTKLNLLHDWIVILRSRYSELLEQREGSWAARPGAPAVTRTYQDAIHGKRRRMQRWLDESRISAASESGREAHPMVQSTKYEMR